MWGCVLCCVSWMGGSTAAPQGAGALTGGMRGRRYACWGVAGEKVAGGLRPAALHSTVQPW